jgi:hypothetical protein
VPARRFWKNPRIAGKLPLAPGHFECHSIIVF